MRPPSCSPCSAPAAVADDARGPREPGRSVGRAHARAFTAAAKRWGRRVAAGDSSPVGLAVARGAPADVGDRCLGAGDALTGQRVEGAGGVTGREDPAADAGTGSWAQWTGAAHRGDGPGVVRTAVAAERRRGGCGAPHGRGRGPGRQPAREAHGALAAALRRALRPAAGLRRSRSAVAVPARAVGGGGGGALPGAGAHRSAGGRLRACCRRPCRWSSRGRPGRWGARAGRRGRWAGSSRSRARRYPRRTGAGGRSGRRSWWPGRPWRSSCSGLGHGFSTSAFIIRLSPDAIVESVDPSCRGADGSSPEAAVPAQ